MSLLQNVSDQLAGPKHSPRQQPARNGTSRDHPGQPHLPQVCWQPESSQLNRPTDQGTAAPGEGKLLQPERQSSPPRWAQGAGYVHGDNRDTREITPPPAQPRVSHLSVPTSHLGPPHDSQQESQRSPGAQGSGGSPGTPLLPARVRGSHELSGSVRQTP